MRDSIADIRKVIERSNLKIYGRADTSIIKNEENFRHELLKGFDKIVSLQDEYKNKPALVMAHGPTLLNIKKNEYNSFLKITCNDFQKVVDYSSKPFFDDNFKPDFWCGANSIEALREPSQVCLNNDIKCLIAIPKKTEFEDYLSTVENRKENLFPWLWGHKTLQRLLAAKYETKETYSHCNTIANHMIAFALWLGCAPIHITGFDMSYVEARKKMGFSHAGYDDGEIKYEPFNGKERKKTLADLRYLCGVARDKGIKIYNLSHEINKLPPTLTFKE
jgi:hypothetical protein